MIEFADVQVRIGAMLEVAGGILIATLLLFGIVVCMYVVARITDSYERATEPMRAFFAVVGIAALVLAFVFLG